jgi:addiction module HigA family antidote
LKESRCGSIWNSTTEEKQELGIDRPISRTPSHPGELMREILEERLGLSTVEAARRIKVPQSGLQAVLDGTAPMTADIALRFARLSGGAPELYVQMQAQYDLWNAREKLKDTLSEIEPAVST